MGAYVTINPTPSGDITGSGTAGYLAMFTSANVIGNSTVNQSSGNTGVGMAASASIGFGITTTAATSGTKTGFYFLQTGNTGQAASTEANGVLWSMGTRQWATGAITDQREFYIGSCAYSFVAASTITNAYGLYVEAPTAGTNATITNPYAAGFSGYVRVIADSSTINLRSLVGTPSRWAIYANQTSPSTTNYCLNGTNNQTAVNGPVDLVLKVADSTKINMDASTTQFIQATITSGASNIYSFSMGANANQTASTEIFNFRVIGNTKTWLAGAITTQRWNYFSANTAAFASASTITNSYGLYVEAATAGTNATITNNYAAGFSGAIRIIGALGSNASIMVDNSTGGYGALWSDGTQGLVFRISSGDVVQFGDINAKNKGIGFLTNGNTRVSIGASGGMTFSDANNITFNAGTGTKIGTATTEKLSFWNKTPIIQPTTGITGAARVGGGGAAVTDTDTFGGYTIAQLAAVIINTGLAA